MNRSRDVRARDARITVILAGYELLTLGTLFASGPRVMTFS